MWTQFYFQIWIPVTQGLFKDLLWMFFLRAHHSWRILWSVFVIDNFTLCLLNNPGRVNYHRFTFPLHLLALRLRIRGYESDCRHVHWCLVTNREAFNRYLLSLPCKIDSTEINVSNGKTRLLDENNSQNDGSEASLNLKDKMITEPDFRLRVFINIGCLQVCFN